MLAFLTSLTMAVGCGLLYLSMGSQQLLKLPLAVWPWRSLAIAMLLTTTVSWFFLLHPTAALFAALYQLMLYASALPFAAFLAVNLSTKFSAAKARSHRSAPGENYGSE